MYSQNSFLLDPNYFSFGGEESQIDIVNQTCLDLSSHSAN
jgi:hypothetical protein